MALQKRHIEHIQIWQASGLTQAVYCQQQGLNATAEQFSISLHYKSMKYN
jgi:hypothetical protein